VVAVVNEATGSEEEGDQIRILHPEELEEVLHVEQEVSEAIGEEELDQMEERDEEELFYVINAQEKGTLRENVPVLVVSKAREDKTELDEEADSGINQEDGLTMLQ
jgi:hypothetical protein